MKIPDFNKRQRQLAEEWQDANKRALQKGSDTAFTKGVYKFK